MILTHLVAFKFLRGARSTDTPIPPIPPSPPEVNSLLILTIFDVYNPIVLLATVNNTKALSAFPKGTKLIFTITNKARYQVPRVTLQSDVCFISIQDPNGVIKKYRDICTKLEDSFYYAYQTSTLDSTGPWKISFYSILNDNHYLTPVLEGFILE